MPFLAVVMALLLGFGAAVPVRAAAPADATPAPSPAAEKTIPVLAYLLDEDERVVPVRRVIEVGPSKRARSVVAPTARLGPTSMTRRTGTTRSSSSRR
jgi:hypothetical protein